MQVGVISNVCQVKPLDEEGAQSVLVVVVCSATCISHGRGVLVAPFQLLQQCKRAFSHRS